MASKDRINFGDFDFDSNLDFDFDDRPARAKGSRKGDKPIDHIVDGVKDSLKTKFSDPAHLRGMFRKALPSGYGQAWDSVETIVGDAERLYDEAVKEIRPQLGSITRNIDSLVPESAGRAKRLSRLLREKLGGDETIDNRRDSSNEEQTDQGVERMFAELEDSRNSRDDYTRSQDIARGAIKDRVDSKRFTINQKTLGLIANSAIAERKFREGFDMSYKKKSLELQYRSYAAMTSLLQNFVEFNKRNIKFQDAMLHNTSLPEYAKTTSATRWKSNIRDAVISKANKSLFGNQSRVALAGKRLMASGREKIDEFKDGLSMLDDMVSMAAEAVQTDKEMAEMVGKKSSGYRTAGTFGGSIIGDMLSDLVSGQVKKLAKKHPGFMKGSFKAGRMAVNPGSLIKAARGSKRFQSLRSSGSESDEMIANGLDKLFDLLRGEDPSMGVKNLSIGSSHEDKSYTQIRTARTINDIIPGYLARILRQLTVMTTGDPKTPLLAYDSKTQRFRSEKRIAADLMVNIRKAARENKVGKDTYAESFAKYSDAFLGEGGKVSTKNKKEVTKFLANLARSTDDMDFTDEGIRDTKEYKALTPAARKEVNAILKKRFSGDSLDNRGNQFRLSTSAMKARASQGNLTGYIEQAIADGHGEALLKAGLVTRDRKTGGWNINAEKYHDQIDDSIDIKSDVNAKTNIKPAKKGKQGAINAFRNTKMYSWNYKTGSTPHKGPMAQDVRKNFGEGAAPGGRKIDLVNMNGNLMEAMQGLIEKVDQMGASESLRHLANIDLNTHRMAQGGFGGGGNGGGGGGGRNYGPGIAGILGALVEEGSSMIGRGAARVGRGAMATADATVDLADRFWKKTQGPAAKAGEAFIRTAINAANAAAKFGNRLITETLPNWGMIGKDILKKGKNLFKDLIQQSKDLYVAGTSSPAIQAGLLRVGYYRDSATGKVLKTMDDVANAMGDIMGADNEVALSLKDRAKGVFDSSGAKLKSFGSHLFQGAAAAAMLAGSVIKDKFRSLKRGIGGVNFKGGFQAAKDKLSGLGGKLQGFGVGFGGDARTVPILLQIRDLLALGKSGKRFKEIMERNIGDFKNADGTTAMTQKADNAILVEENPEKANASMMTQVRDLIASDKPKEVVADILNRSKSANALMKAPIVGNYIKKYLDKHLPSVPQQGQPGNLVPEIAGPAPEMVGPMPQGQGQSSQGGLFDSLSNLAGAAKTGVGDFGDAFKKRNPKAAGKLGGLFSKIGSTRAGRFLGRGFGAGGILSRVAGGTGSVLSALFGGNKDENKKGDNDKTANQAPMNKTAADYDARMGNLSRNKLVNGYRRVKGIFGDANGDGQRDGGAADRIADMVNAQTANEERKNANVKASQAAAAAKANKYSPADDAIEKMIKIATAGIAGLAGTAGNLLGGAADLLMGGGKGKWGRKIVGGIAKAGGWAAKGVGALATGAGALASKLGTVGRGIMGVASKVPGSSAVARTAVGATRALQVVGLMGGGAGSVISGGLGLIGSFLSSPVVIGAAAVGGVGYGGYKLYKYFTRNNIDDYQRIRVMQYGLDGTDATKSFNSKVMALEKYMLDGNISFSGNTPDFNSRSMNMKDIYELFDIAEDDSDMKGKFDQWFAYRFRPVLLHHIATLYRIDNKATLEKVADLDAPKKLDYLSGADIGGVWDKTVSPFKGLDVLSDNPKPCRDLINAMIKTVGEEVQKNAKTASKGGEGKAKGADAINATKAVTSAVPEAAKNPAPNKYSVDGLPATTKNVPGAKNSPIPANSRLGREMALEVEEGKAPNNTPTTMTFAAGGGSASLKSASGPVSSGDSGMQYIKLGKDATIEGLNPALKKNLMGMAQEYGEATGKSILINEGFRSFQRQAELFRKYGPGRAARPGSSLHEYGLALDINTGIMDELEKLGLLRKYGFTRPIRGETWHTEPAGIQQAIARAKQDPKFAEAAILSSLGRGGGGFGSTPNSSKGGRNPALAKMLYESTGGSEVNLTDTSTNLPAGSSNSLQSPMVGGQPAVSASAIKNMAGPGYASVGRDSASVESSGNFDASGSLGDGTGKYDGIKSDIAKYAKEAGLDPNKMMMMAAMESSMNPNAKAKKGTASGLMQFLNETWDEQMGKHGGRYGLNNDRGDVRSQVILGGEYMKSKANSLRKAAGRDLEFVDEYMGHFFGQGGASRMLRANPNASAASILPKSVANNREIFYDGTRPRTVSEVRDLLNQRIQTKAKAFGINMGGTVTGGTDAPASASATSLAQPTAAPATPIAYKPTFGTPTPMSADTVAGQNIALGTLPFFGKKDGSTTAAPAMSISATAPSRAPSGGLPTAMSAGASSVRDTATVVTTELFAKLTQSSDTQIKHLSSIDDSILTKVVPLLEKVAEHTAGIANLTGNAGSSDSKSTPSVPSNGAGRVNRQAADKSSFDNRRMT